MCDKEKGEEESKRMEHKEEGKILLMCVYRNKNKKYIREKQRRKHIKTTEHARGNVGRHDRIREI